MQFLAINTASQQLKILTHATGDLMLFIVLVKKRLEPTGRHTRLIRRRSLSFRRALLLIRIGSVRIRTLLTANGLQKKRERA